MYCMRVIYSSGDEETTWRSIGCSRVVPTLSIQPSMEDSVWITSWSFLYSLQAALPLQVFFLLSNGFLLKESRDGSLVNSVFLCFLSLKCFLNFLCPKSFPSPSKNYDTLKVIGPHKFTGSGAIVRCGLVGVGGLLEGNMSLQGQAWGLFA